MNWTENKWLKPAWMSGGNDFVTKYQDKFAQIGEKFGAKRVKVKKKTVENKDGDSIISMLNRYVRNEEVASFAKQAWKNSFLDDGSLEEWGFIIVERVLETYDDEGLIDTENTIGATNLRTDHNGNGVYPNEDVASNETILGRFHTHPYELDLPITDIAFSAADIWNLLDKTTPDYVSIVQTTHKRYALVLRDVSKANSYRNSSSKDQFIDEMATHMQETMAKHDDWLADKLQKEAISYIIKDKGLRFYETAGVSKISFLEVK